MDVILVKEKAMESVTEHFGWLAKKVEELCGLFDGERVREYLDNQDVCVRLNVSKRTLQYYRDSGKISFTCIGNKVYYRTADIERFLNERMKKR